MCVADDATLRSRVIKIRKALDLTQSQAAADALVAVDTLKAAEMGKSLRNLTRQRLEAWIARAERRLERRVPRP
jgi:DNA-binding XRE family transcriptional regulator